MAQIVQVPQEVSLLSGLLNNVGLAVARDGARETGIAMLRRAMALDPLDAGRRVNLASLLIGVGEDEEAEHLLTGALGQSDKIVCAWQMMGTLKTHRGRLGEAIACFERVLALAPDNPQAKFDLAAAHMRAGDFARGLPLYEFRSELLPRTAPPPAAPRWTGEKVAHLAVWGDQGYGDRVMFARFLPWARERAGKITFLTDANTVPLLYGYKDAIGDVGCFYDPATRFDAQICLSSLPLLYGLTLDNIPPDPGLLMPAHSTNELAAAGLKIGIAWAGNKDHPNDSIRTMPFAELLPLASDPRNDVFSLQCGPPAADIAKAQAQRIVGDMSGMIQGEWAHTAAVIGNLDLVVTVDTAIAHIAGALGKPTFLLLPLFNDWRWLHGRDDSPWYPSLKLFRQEKALDWRGAMKRVMAALAHLHQDRALSRMLTREIRNVTFGKEPDVGAVLHKVLRPGDCFVDVGANVGLHTTVAARLVGPGGKVLAFEPGSNNLPELRAAVADLPQVEIIEDPAWSGAGEVMTFHLCADGGGGNALWDPGEFPCNDASRATPQSVELITTTLGHEIADRPGLNPRLIKIDTEGADQRVLEGASALLRALHPPFIVTELHEFGLDKLGCSQASLRALMRGHGYDTFVLFADGSKPKRLAPEEVITSRIIVNLLFSTPAEVDALWTVEPKTDQRAIFGYAPAHRPEPKPRTALEAAIAAQLGAAASLPAISISTKEGHHGKPNGHAAE